MNTRKRLDVGHKEIHPECAGSKGLSLDIHGSTESQQKLQENSKKIRTKYENS